MEVATSWSAQLVVAGSRVRRLLVGELSCGSRRLVPKCEVPRVLGDPGFTHTNGARVVFHIQLGKNLVYGLNTVVVEVPLTFVGEVRKL